MMQGYCKTKTGSTIDESKIPVCCEISQRNNIHTRHIICKDSGCSLKDTCGFW
jgi:hypothetical protein